MMKFKASFLSLAAGMALLLLTGCDQLEQAKNDTLEKAKQTAIAALQEATQSGSIGQAEESASQVLIDAKKAAAGLLDQAGKYLEQDTQDQKPGNTSEEESSSAI